MLAGSLFIELGANVARLAKDLNEAKGLVGGAMSKISEMVGVAKQALAGLGLGLGVAGLAALVKGVTDAVDSLNDLSDATGASVENLSALQDIARRTGTSIDTVGSSVIKFNQALGSTMKPGSDAEKVLKSLGLSAKALREMDPAEALQQTAIAMAKFADDGNKARAAQELFGKSLKEVAPFLKDVAEAGKLNATVTTEQALAAERFNKQLFNMQADTEALKREIVMGLVPALSLLLQNFRAIKALGGLDLILKDSARALFTGDPKMTGDNGADINRGIARRTELERQLASAQADGRGRHVRTLKEEIATENRYLEVLRAKQSNELLAAQAGEVSDAVSRKQQARTSLRIPDEHKLTEALKARQKAEEERMKWGRSDVMRQGDAFLKSIEDEGKATAEALKAGEALYALNGKRLDQNVEIQRATEDILKKIQDETAGLAMSNVERETAIALRELEVSKIDKTSEAYLRLKEAIPKAVADREAAREHKRIWESIDNTAHDVFVNIFEGGSNAFKKLGQTLKASVLDLLYQMTVKKWILNFAASGTGQGISSLIGGGDSAGGLGNLLSLGSNGGGIFSVGSQVLSGSMSVANGAGTLYANAAGTGLDGLLATNGAYGTAGAGSAAGGLGGMGAMAGAAAAMAIIVKGFVEMYNNTKGEVRGGGQYGWNSATGGADFLEGPSGGDPNADLSKGVISTAAASISAGLKAIGSNLTLSAFKGAWEQSINGRGGVFSGGSLSNGVGFGESGAGTNYQWSNPFNSKYEMWGAEDGQTDAYGSGGGASYRGLIGSFDMSGDPAELATDAQQAMIGAIQAAFNLVPKIVTEKFSLSAFTQFGEINTEVGEGTGTRWLRMYDEAVKAELRASMPKRLQDLGLIDIDPELLSAEDTQKLTEKLTALFQNVNGFRTIVENLPIERLRQASFDVAAGLVEMAGGLEQFAANLSSYVDNFYTQEEKRIQVAKNLQKQVAAVGLNFSVEEILGGSRAKFRELVEMFEGATDEAGMKTYTVLLSIAGAFASITPEAEAAAAASSDYSDSLRIQIDLLEETIDKYGEWADSLKRFMRELTVGQLAQNSPYEQYMRTSAEFNRLNAMDPKSEERLTGLEEAGRAFLEASNAYNALNPAYFADLEKVKAAVEASELAARAQVDVARLQLNALLAIQANTSAGGSTTVAGAGGSSGGAVFGGGATAAPAATLPTGSVLTSTGVPFDLAAWSMQNLHDPAGIAAMAQRYGKTQQWFADVSNQSLESVRLWFSNQGIPAFENGTNYVDRTGLAWLHEGEAVQPKRYNPAAGGGDWSGMESRLDAIGQKVERLIAVSAAGARQSGDALEQIADNTAEMSATSSLDGARARPLGMTA